MSEQATANVEQVTLLLAAISAKLNANSATVARSLAYGRVTWRQKPDKRFEVDLEPKL